MTRPIAIAALVLTIALGLASRRVHTGIFVWDKSLGDALYTAMIYFLVALVRPSLSPKRLGAIALTVSLVVEIFQLTGIPARLPPIFRLALGTTFAWHDVACYVVAAAVVTATHLALTRRARA